MPMYFTKGFGFGRVSNERQTAFPVPGAADAENALPHRDRDRSRPSEREHKTTKTPKTREGPRARVSTSLTEEEKEGGR